MKLFFKKLFKYWIPTAVAFAGIPLVLYGIWFQTLGFTLPELNGYYLGFSLVAGGGAGVILARYLDNQYINPNLGKRAARQGISSMLIGTTCCFFICIVVLYLCTTMLTFYIGVAGSLFGCCALLYHFIFVRVKHFELALEAQRGEKA